MGDPWPLSAFGDEIADELDEQVDVLGREGIRYIELRSAWKTNVVDLSGEQIQKVRHTLAAAGIGVSAIASPLGKTPISGDFRLEEKRLTAAIEAAILLECRLIRVFSFFIPDATHEVHRAEVLRRMEKMAQMVEREGLTLVHENESYIYGDIPSRCRDIAESVGSAALRLVYDPGNYVQVSPVVGEAAWTTVHEFVAHVHIKDSVPVDRTRFDPYPAEIPVATIMASIRLAGDGDGQIAELLHSLHDEHYDGFLTLEPHMTERMAKDSGATRLSAAAAALRNLINSQTFAKH